MCIDICGDSFKMIGFYLVCLNQGFTINRDSDRDKIAFLSILSNLLSRIRRLALLNESLNIDHGQKPQLPGAFPLG